MNKILVFCLIFSLLDVILSTSYYEETAAESLLNEWNKNDPDYDPSDDDKEDHSKKNFEERHKMGIQPKMVVIHMIPGIKYKETDKYSSIWEIKLKNALLPIQRYIVNESTVIFSMSETSQLKKVVDFLTKEYMCKEIVVDSITHKCATRPKEMEAEL